VILDDAPIPSIVLYGVLPTLELIAQLDQLAIQPCGGAAVRLGFHLDLVLQTGFGIEVRYVRGEDRIGGRESDVQRV
jgi:hypothetical protein